MAGVSLDGGSGCLNGVAKQTHRCVLDVSVCRFGTCCFWIMQAKAERGTGEPSYPFSPRLTRAVAEAQGGNPEPVFKQMLALALECRRLKASSLCVALCAHLTSTGHAVASPMLVVVIGRFGWCSFSFSFCCVGWAVNVCMAFRWGKVSRRGADCCCVFW